MKTSASIFVLAISLTTTSSIAADLAVQKAPPVVAQSNAMRGFYIGINGGYGGGDFTAYQNQYNPSPYGSNVFSVRNVTRAGGALAGGQVGYNYIFRDQYLIGGEVDVDWANINNGGGFTALGLGGGSFGSSSSSNYGNGTLGLQWIGTARLRLGYQIGSLTPFLSGGVAFGGTNFSSSQNNLYQGVSGTYSYNGFGGQNGNNSTVSAGWAVGAGLEYALAQNWSIKTEYLYTQISAPSSQNVYAFSGGTNGSAAGPFIAGGSSEIGVHQVRFGVNYHPHLFEASPVLVAKY